MKKLDLRRLSSLVALLLVVSLGTIEAARQPILEESVYRRATVTYTAGFDFNDFSPERNNVVDLGFSSIRPWGEHPILWKGMVSPDLELDPYGDPNQGFPLFEGVPGDLKLNVGDSVLLNNYEASGAFTDTSGAIVDPSGHWVETFSTDGEEVAILAAMAMWRWSTPVYINYTNIPNPGQLMARVAVIDSVTLSTPSGVPHVVCGWDDPDASTSCPGLVIESVTMSYYSDARLCCNGTLEYFGAPEVGGGSDEVLGADFVNAYESPLSAFYAGPVIYDPPATSGFSSVNPESLELASRAQASGSVLLRNRDGSLSKSK